MRRVLVSVLLAALASTAVGSYIQATRIDSDSAPGWVADNGQPDKVVRTPLLSVRRTPGWLSDPVTEARLLEQLRAVAEMPVAPSQTCVAMYRNGEPVLRRQADEPLVPASLMKIVTAAVILETAGPDATFTTEAFVRFSDLNAAEGGILTGDIFLVGRGDPVLSTPSYILRFDDDRTHTDFTLLADQAVARLRNLGITRVDGAILADETRFPEAERDYTSQFLQPGGEPIWKQSYVTSNQVGPLSALLLNDGYVSFPASTDFVSRRRNQRADDPALHAAQVFDGLLSGRNVFVTAPAGKAAAPARDELYSLGVVESPPLAEIVTRMLSDSDNTTAEMLLKDIGRRFSGSARANAVSDVTELLQRRLNVSSPGMLISDGSGLSIHNRLSCDLVARLLLTAGPNSPLVEGLAVVGESGTLRDCEASSSSDSDSSDSAELSAGEVASDSSEGIGDLGGLGIDTNVRVWAKTGTLNDVSALAGVTVARNGDVLTFALISNRQDLIFDLGVCNVLQRSLIAVAEGHPYGPSSADTALHPLPALVSTANTGADAGSDGSGEEQ